MMGKLVHWTEEQRQVESDLGVAEVRKRIAALAPADRYETVVRFVNPDAYLTSTQAGVWAKLADVLPAQGAEWGGETVQVHGTEIVRVRSMDELAQLVCILEIASRAATPGRPAVPAEERG